MVTKMLQIGLAGLLVFLGAVMLVAILAGAGAFVAAAVFSVLMALVAIVAPLYLVYWLITRQAGWSGGRRHGASDWHQWKRWKPSGLPRPVDWERDARATVEEITRLVREGDRSTRQMLAGVPKQARKLADRVVDLSRCYQRLEGHLRGNDAATLLRQSADMEQRAHGTADPYARQQYLEAAAALQRQSEVCLELARTRERLRAESTRILAALAGLRSRIVAVQSGMPTGETNVEHAADELADLELQVETFQESVNQVLRQASRAAR